MQGTLYFFSIFNSSEFKIRVATVEKETKGQYIISYNNGSIKRTLNKRDLGKGSMRFYKTYEEAEKGVIDWLKLCIDSLQRDIAYKEDQVTRYKAFLKEHFNLEV